MPAKRKQPTKPTKPSARPLAEDNSGLTGWMYVLAGVSVLVATFRLHNAQATGERMSVLDMVSDTMTFAANGTTFTSYLDAMKLRRPVIMRTSDTVANDWDVMHWTLEDWEANLGDASVNVLRLNRTSTFSYLYQSLRHLDNHQAYSWLLPSLDYDKFAVAMADVTKLVGRSTPDSFYYASGDMSEAFPGFDDRYPWKDHFVAPRVNDDGDLDTENPVGGVKSSKMTFIISSDGAKMNLHNDEPHNLVFQTYGKKTFVLFPPDVCDDFYLAPFEHELESVTVIPDIFDADLSRFPHLTRAFGLGVRVNLEPGDLFYSPPRWCHLVMNGSPSVTLQAWSPAMEHLVGGAGSVSDSISYYLARLAIPFDMTQVKQQHVPAVVSTFMCYYFSALFGDAAAAMREYFELHWEHVPNQLYKEEVLPQEKTFHLEPCCVSPPGSVDVQVIETGAHRAASIVSKALPDLRRSIAYQYMDMMVTTASDAHHFATAKSFMQQLADQCARPGQQHLMRMEE